MSFGTAISTCFKKYVTFRGRASRSEFWWFYLFLFLVSLVAYLIDSLLGLKYGSATFTMNDTVYVVKDAYRVGILQTIWGLATILPLLAVMARRYHDAGHSGLWIIWNWLLTFACLAGVVIMIVFFVQKSQPGETKYGPQPTS